MKLRVSEILGDALVSKNAVTRTDMADWKSEFENKLRASVLSLIEIGTAVQIEAT